MISDCHKSTAVPPQSEETLQTQSKIIISEKKGSHHVRELESTQHHAVFLAICKFDVELNDTVSCHPPYQISLGPV